MSCADGGSMLLEQAGCPRLRISTRPTPKRPSSCPVSTRPASSSYVLAPKNCRVRVAGRTARRQRDDPLLRAAEAAPPRPQPEDKSCRLTCADDRVLESERGKDVQQNEKRPACAGPSTICPTGSHATTSLPSQQLSCRCLRGTRSERHCRFAAETAHADHWSAQ